MPYLSIIESYLGKKITNYNFIESGRDFDVCITDNLVFRFPKTEEKRHGMEDEKRKLDIIREYISFAIPKPEIIENQYMVYPSIKGEPLSDDPFFYNDSLISQIVLFIKELHNIPLEKFGYQTTSNESSENDQSKGFVDFLKNDMHQKLGKIISKDGLGNIHKYLDELFFSYKSKDLAFVHTDLQGKNIILEEKGNISGIIDFTDSRIGGIELDFCHFYEIGEDILKQCILKYKGVFDNDFYERVFFLAKRNVIFEINNDKLFEHEKDRLIQKLRRYKFI